MENRRIPPAKVPKQPDPPASPAASPHCVTSEQLLGGTGELVIMHGGRQYRLRLTQNGKLILTA